MTFPLANQMVRPKKRQSLAPWTHWKVTARYTVEVMAGRGLRCVRVSSLGGTVLHFSERRFRQLFEAAP